MTTPNNGIPFVPENTTDPAAGLNVSLLTIDDLLQLVVETLGNNTPVTATVDGERHIVGPAPTGVWTDHANELAVYILDSDTWRFHTAVLALNKDDGTMYRFSGGSWAELTSSSASTTLAGLTDVNLTGLADGDMLRYDATSGTWLAVESTAGVDTLADLTDTDITSPSDGDALVYDTDTSKWVPGTAAIADAPSDGKIYGRKDGAWVEITTENIGDGSGATWDGLVYISDQYGIVEGVDSSDQSQLWENKTDNYSSQFFYQDATDTRLFMVDDADTVWVFEKSTGAMVKSFVAPAGSGWPYGIVVDDSERVYVAIDKFLRRFDTGTELQDWAYEAPNNRWIQGVARDPSNGNIAFITSETTAALPFLVVLGSDGTLVDTADVENGGENAIAVAFDGSSNLYVLFSGNPGGFVRKYNSSLVSQWERTTGNQSGQGKGVVGTDGVSYWSDENSGNEITIVAADGLSHSRVPAAYFAGIAVSPDNAEYVTLVDDAGTHYIIGYSVADDTEQWRYAVQDGASNRTVTGINF